MYLAVHERQQKCDRLVLYGSLDLRMNQIVDVSPLGTLTSLDSLYLSQNQIVDVSPLSTLTSLLILDLSRNQIVDVSPLSTLTSQRLFPGENQIVDLSCLDPLVAAGCIIEMPYDSGQNVVTNELRFHFIHSRFVAVLRLYQKPLFYNKAGRPSWSQKCTEHVSLTSWKGSAGY